MRESWVRAEKNPNNIILLTRNCASDFLCFLSRVFGEFLAKYEFNSPAEDDADRRELVADALEK